MKSILIVCTSADKISDVPTGSWAEEVAAPYFAFKVSSMDGPSMHASNESDFSLFPAALFQEQGHSITIASIKGGEIPFDDASLNPPYLTKEAEKFILDAAVMELLENSKPISEVDFLAYDAIFLPGGHGTCVDLPTNETLLKGLAAAYSAGKVISAVCHGAKLILIIPFMT